MTPNLHATRRQFRPVKTIPQSEEAERAVIGCAIEFCAETMPQIQTKPAELLFDLRNATIFQQLKILWQKRRVIDSLTIRQALKDAKILKQCGGDQHLATCSDAVTSPANLPYWLKILSEKHALRKLAGVCSDVQERLTRNEGDVKDLCLGIQADLDTVTRLGLNGEARKPALIMWKPSDLEAYNPPESLRLVGDNEIVKGYEGLSLLAGPGSAGKSLAGHDAGAGRRGRVRYLVWPAGASAVSYDDNPGRERGDPAQG